MGLVVSRLFWQFIKKCRRLDRFPDEEKGKG